MIDKTHAYPPKGTLQLKKVDKEKKKAKSMK